MNVLMIAAGFCTRMNPLTEYFPKGLLPVGGKPILTYILDEAVRLPGVSATAIVTNHRYAPIMTPWAVAAYPGTHIDVLDNGVTAPGNRLGAIGDILYAVDRLGWDDDLLVLASDTLVSLSLGDFVRFSADHRGVVLPVFRTPDRSRIAGKLGCAVLEGDRLVSFVEKPADPPSDYIGVPYYFFPREAIPLMREYRESGGSMDAPGSVIPFMIGRIPTYGYRVDGYYHDIGTVEAYNAIAGSFSVPV